ncbi:anhydro-N-acetylmuramic acid kinase [Mesonia sp.]|uniref:anhydro-N-acetylmuramic acid kinase n=1 Tax=Mesonia sp. TaxID=1960830 RepID=UPI001777A1DA|nr:anhydro-N-acetylmuramic acid kinase [Mesonia sp.]HIB38475.1 anhydro-N-acetylmuramic acid kinase [Mesonia sp.]HIO27135.1 anhydro-N-acetylmuramic acid kinase [Flavobacteriaceae bacterium]
MRRKQFRVLGVMSGTSLDGIDLAYLAFTSEEHWKASILKAETIPYSQKWVEALKTSAELSRPDIAALDEKYTDYLAEVIQQFIQKNKIEKLDAVCSHGHTVLHQPAEGFTIQIGNLPKLATILQQKVVCDFRVQDVELGGQGAPLVPIGDRLLFGDYDYCLNLGGFANISTEIENKRIAYDICPVNTVLNEYASRLGFAFDSDGVIARNAEVNQDLLKELTELSFYQQKPPKSLGIEWVNSVIFPILEKSESTSEEIIATFTEHVAVQLSENIQHHSSQKVLVTGGGAFNTYLIELLQQKTKSQIILPQKNLIEFKEALIFGFLGVLRLENEINVLASVTGASKNHSSGKIFEV